MKRTSTLVVEIVLTTAMLAVPAANAAPGMFEGDLRLRVFGLGIVTVTPNGDPGDIVDTALPLGAFCNPAESGGMTCSPTATLQVGAPLTGRWTTSVGAGSPASIMVPSGQLGQITFGSFPQRYPSQIYQKTYANLLNAAGNFQAGGGPGSVTHVLGLGFSAQIIPGKNQFGGVMRLLKGGQTPKGRLTGGFGTKAKYTYPATSSMYVNSFPTWGFTFVGATSSGGYPALGTVTGTIFHTTITSIMFPYTGMVRGWPWTTGIVRVRAYGDYLYSSIYFAESFARTGYDNRTSLGWGTIQFVTPHLMEWEGVVQFGAIGVFRVRFVPEPLSGLVLLAGAGLLGVLYQRRKRW
jgi:hypothetical protein